MPFEFQRTKIPDVILIKPKMFEDDRGFFMETYKQSDFKEAGIDVNFVQMNHSRSTYGVIRGLHLQHEPYAQSKLVRCIKGEIFDVAVDVRKGSTTFGKYIYVELSEENNCMLYIPKGFAHGFQVLSNESDIIYLADAEYSPNHEDGIIWNDDTLDIQWPIINPKVSEKDQHFLSLQDLLKESRSGSFNQMIIQK